MTILFIFQTKSKEEIKQYVQLLLDKEEKKRQKLKEMGIEYNFPGYVNMLSLIFVESLCFVKERKK